jgi:hypothetical protein
METQALVKKTQQALSAVIKSQIFEEPIMRKTRSSLNSKSPRTGDPMNFLKGAAHKVITFESITTQDV